MHLNTDYKPKLLLVDDDLPTRLLLRRVLAKEGYDTADASNGQEALDVLKEQRPDLILMDVMMPVMDGYAACARIRQLEGYEALPIIMLTGAEDMEAIESAFNAGATDFITKPINWPLLSQRVRYALRTDMLNREVRQNRVREAAVRKIAGLGFWEWNPVNDALNWTQELLSLTGIAPEQVDGIQAFMPHLHEDDRARFEATLENARQTGQRVDLEVRLQTPQGSRVLRLIGDRIEQGENTGHVFMGAFQDITETRKAEALVDYLAFHDELTGLGNRRLFIRQVDSVLAETRATNGKVVLVGCLDLLRFHRFNDELGETAANAVLVKVAQTLRSHVAGGAEVARLDGDAFAVMLTAKDAAQADERFQRLLHAFERPMRVDAHELVISVSAGVALYPEHAADADHLLSMAQEAQRAARAQGRLYATASADPVGSQQRFAALELERALRQALEKQEFFLLYQPQLSLQTHTVVGAEALLRWRHPVHGVIPPVQFIPVLEEMGLINQVGEWVLRDACRQAAQWASNGLPLRVGINLSPRQFLDPNLAEVVESAARDAQVNTQLIELEITESLAMQDFDRSIRLLERFRQGGFKIAIDDFGIGYSSLEYLLRFPLDAIKIDRAFITNITAKPADRAIVHAVTVLGRTLGVQVIAEGVETQRQSDFIEALDVSEIQGYLIGKPMPADELEVLARVYTAPE